MSPSLLNPAILAPPGLGSSAYRDEVLADLPFLYYPLDDAIGSTVMLDWSGNDLHGTYTNGPTLEEPGAFSDGTSARFHRASTQYGDSAAGTGGIYNASTLSVEGWFNTDSGSRGSPQRVIMGRIAGLFGFAGWEWSVGTNGKLGMVFTGVGGGVIGSAAQSPATVDDAGWHHGVATYDGSVIELYVDKINVASASATSATTSNNDAVHVGMDRTAVGSSPFAMWEGWLQHLAYYKGVVLSATRVEDHFDAAMA